MKKVSFPIIILFLCWGCFGKQTEINDGELENTLAPISSMDIPQNIVDDTIVELTYRNTASFQSQNIELFDIIAEEYLVQSDLCEITEISDTIFLFVFEEISFSEEFLGVEYNFSHKPVFLIDLQDGRLHYLFNVMGPVFYDDSTECLITNDVVRTKMMKFLVPFTDRYVKHMNYYVISGYSIPDLEIQFTYDFSEEVEAVFSYNQFVQKYDSSNRELVYEYWGEEFNDVYPGPSVIIDLDDYGNNRLFNEE